MQRRHFSLGVLAGLTATAVFPGVSIANPKDEYSVITPPLSNDAPKGKVQVIEFFAYSCGYCFQMMPKFSAWEKTAPSTAHIQRVPVSFREVVEPHARIFYTLEALGRLDDMHTATFKAVLEERKNLITPKEIEEFFAKHNIDTVKAMSIYNSFGIQAKVQKANQLVKAYGIQGTPAVGIGGRYYMTGAREDGFKVIEGLIKKVRPAA